MVITISTKHEYVPEFNGNRDLPPTEQMKVRHKMPTVAIKESVFPRKFDFGAKGEITGSFVIDRKKLFQALTDEFIGFEYMLDGEVKKIDTVEKLFKAPVEFDPLIEEIYNYYNGLLNQKPNEKN